jgi:LCP family protein required for cell wall assembly
MALVLAAGAVGYAVLAGKIKTFDTSGLSKVRPAETAAINILLIGTDARGGENSVLGGGGDNVGRSDTTIIVHIYPGAKSAVAVSIPRDSLVTVPSCKLPNGQWTQPQYNVMFNSAFSVGESPQGNPSCTVNTVEKMTGLRMDHTVVVNFAGFAAMSTAVGGVPVCVPNDVYQGDLNPNLGYRGALLFHAGRQIVSGAKALQYVRVRHGIGDGSDIGRIKRQQAFLSSLVVTMEKQGLSVSHLWPLVNAATSAMTFDPSLSSPLKLLEFAKQIDGLKPSAVEFLTVPWRYDGYRVAIVQPDANELWAALRANRPLTNAKPTVSAAGSASKTTVPRGSGAVKVLNGTWTGGIATRIAKKLTAAGFAATAGNAPVRNATTTTIHYRPADKARAQLLARYLKATLVPDSTATTLTVVLGTSHRWIAGGTTAPQKKLPSSVTGDIRKATADACSNLSYG